MKFEMRSTNTNTTYLCEKKNPNELLIEKNFFTSIVYSDEELFSCLSDFLLVTNLMFNCQPTAIYSEQTRILQTNKC